MPFKINAGDSHGLQRADNCVCRACAHSLQDNAERSFKRDLLRAHLYRRLADDEY